RETGPLLGLERDLTPLPGALAQLHGRLDQRELVRPRCEAALAAELVEAAEDAESRVVRRLESGLVELVPAPMWQRGAPARHLEPRRAEQQRVQLLDCELSRPPLSLQICQERVAGRRRDHAAVPSCSGARIRSASSGGHPFSTSSISAWRS